MSDKEVFRKVTGKSGNTWLVKVVPPAGSKVYRTNNPENTTGKGGGYGFGGATISFTTVDGEFKAHGPWHSNAEALYEDTELDIRHLHLTRVWVAEGAGFEEGSYKTVPHGEVYYRENVPAMGEFHRGKAIGQAIANLYQKRVFVYSESDGGSSCTPINPEE